MPLLQHRKQQHTSCMLLLSFTSRCAKAKYILTVNLFDTPKHIFAEEFQDYYIIFSTTKAFFEAWKC